MQQVKTQTIYTPSVIRLLKLYLRISYFINMIFLVFILIVNLLSACWARNTNFHLDMYGRLRLLFNQ